MIRLLKIVWLAHFLARAALAQNARVPSPSPESRATPAPSPSAFNTDGFAADYAEAKRLERELVEAEDEYQRRSAEAARLATEQRHLDAAHRAAHAAQVKEAWIRARAAYTAKQARKLAFRQWLQRHRPKRPGPRMGPAR
jgi:hypothetical protein